MCREVDDPYAGTGVFAQEIFEGLNTHETGVSETIPSRDWPPWKRGRRGGCLGSGGDLKLKWAFLELRLL